MTRFERFIKGKRMLEAIYVEAAKVRTDPAFCRNQLWYATSGQSGNVGLAEQLRQQKSGDERDMVFDIIKEAMPPCNHEGNDCRGNYPNDPTSISRECKPFGSVIDQLNEAGGGESATGIVVRHINDDNEPTFLVRNRNDARTLFLTLGFGERIAAGEISKGYAYNSAFHTVSDDDAAKIVAAEVSFETKRVADVLAFRPMVMCFNNDALLAKLKGLGLRVVMLNDIPKSLDDVRAKLPVIVDQHAGELRDMPGDVLDGWLGEVYRKHMGCWPIAYAWPALVSIASALVPNSPVRTNLYTALVGPMGSGKSHCFKHAMKLLGIKEPQLVKMMTGSAEGMLSSDAINEANGDSRLLATDELGHLLEKAKIQQSSFPFVLNTAYYESKFKVTMAQGKKVDFDCILSVIGGLVEDKFQDLFGSATTGGLYDRFIFGNCPDGFKYNYRPLDEVESVLATDDGVFGAASRPTPIRVDREVWPVLDEWRKKFDNRVVESALRVAAICAAFDNREVLRPGDLGPALAFAGYQQRIRVMLRPNPGVNPDGIVAHKVLDFLRRAGGGWVNVKTMLQKTHAYDLGPNVAKRVVDVLIANNDIEMTKEGKSMLVRLVVEAPLAAR
jgi:hypothetical protein